MRFFKKGDRLWAVCRFNIWGIHKYELKIKLFKEKRRFIGRLILNVYWQFIQTNNVLEVKINNISPSFIPDINFYILKEKIPTGGVIYDRVNESSQ